MHCAFGLALRSLAERLPHTEHPDIYLFLPMDRVVTHSHFFLSYSVPAGKAYQKEKAPGPMFYQFLNPVSLLEPIPESDSLRKKSAFISSRVLWAPIPLK